MTWFKLDDGFHSHPKIIAVGNEAAGLYARCGSYCAQHLTDGFIPEAVGFLYGGLETIDALCNESLWTRVSGGWLMHDYLVYNPSRKQVQAERQRGAERQKQWRERQSKDQQSNGVTNGVTNAVTPPLVTPFVTAARPDPLTTTTKEPPPLRGAPPRAAARGPQASRIPADFQPTTEMLDWALRETPNVPIQPTTEDFCDYWASKAGKEALKVDWNRTWKRWMRKASQDAPRARGNGHQLSTGDRKYLETQALKDRLRARRGETPQLPMTGAS